MGVEEIKPKVLLPEGSYVVMLDQYTEGPNKKGTGIRGTLEFTVKQRDSEFTGQKLYLDINPKNPNLKAEEISTKSINSFLMATGDCPNGLADIAHDRTKIGQFNDVSVVAIVKQKMAGEYVNAQGVKVAAKLKNEIYGFQAK